MIPRIPRHEIPWALALTILVLVVWDISWKVGYQTYLMMHPMKIKSEVLR